MCIRTWCCWRTNCVLNCLPHKEQSYVFSMWLLVWFLYSFLATNVWSHILHFHTSCSGIVGFKIRNPNADLKHHFYYIVKKPIFYLTLRSSSKRIHTRGTEETNKINTIITIKTNLAHPQMNSGVTRCRRLIFTVIVVCILFVRTSVCSSFVSAAFYRM